MIIKSRYVMLLSLCTLLVTSCTLYRKPVVPSLNHPDQFKVKVKISKSTVNANWWENFHDEHLNKLVQTALKNNLTYQIALKNIDVAATFVSQNFSGLFPQVGLGFNSSRNKSAEAIFNTTGSVAAVTPNNTGRSALFNLQQLSGTVSYQLDIWNQIRNSVRQAEANQIMSEADSDAAKLTLITSVVGTYFQIQAAHANLSNLKKQRLAALDILAMYRSQYRGGLVDYSLLDDAKNQVDTLVISIRSLEKQSQVLQFTLATLVGEYPEHFTFKSRPGFHHLGGYHLIPSGIPAMVVASRPDIQKAYYQVISAGYLQKQTIANFLPAINLTGTYGYASTALTGLITERNSFWNYGLYATQFLFDYQNRMSQYRRAQYQYEVAILNYKQVALTAFKEVDSALVSYRQDNEALLAYRKQTNNTKDQLMLASSKYKAGLTNYTIFATSKLNYLQSEFNLTNQRLVVIQDVIQVYAALGLGLA